jgi:hypothetical protein
MIVTLAHKLLIALWTTQQWGDAGGDRPQAGLS